MGEREGGEGGRDGVRKGGSEEKEGGGCEGGEKEGGGREGVREGGRE